MANYESKSRTNYFRVKDARAFRNWASELDVEVVENDKTEGLFALLDNGSGSFPDHRENPDTGETDEIDFFAELSRHLVAGEVVIIHHVGWEKHRYLNGVATALNSKGETCHLTLDEIYERAAAQFGVPRESITNAEY